jgi:hypothetical protein
MIRSVLALFLLASVAPRATVIAGGAIQPHLAAAEDGTFFAVFIRNGSIECATSADKGKTWSTPVVAIDGKGKAVGGMQRGPRVAVDAKKTVYVTAPLCFDEAEFAKKYPTQDLYLAVSTDEGKTFSKPVQVNDVPKQAPESLHWLAAAPNGDVFVAWLDRRQRGTSPGQDLAYVKITEQGKKIGKNQILQGPLCECCAPGLSVDAKGNPTIIYREAGKKNRPIMVAGGPSLSRVVRVNQAESKVDSCPMDAPSVAVSADGKKTVVAWMDMRSGKNDRDVQWTVGSEGRFAPEATIHDVTAGTQGHPSLAFDKDGIAWCAWEDGRTNPNLMQIYVADFKSKKNLRISEDAEGKCGYPSLALGGGVLGVAYEAGGGVSFRVIGGP